MNFGYEYYPGSMLWNIAQTIIIYAVWVALMMLLKGRVRRIAAIVGAMLGLSAIILLTLLGRADTGVRDLSLIPFVTIFTGKAHPDYFRTLYMNMLLFMPLGLSLPFALHERIKRPVPFTLISGTALSVTVELIQLIFRVGKCETDDVIMNVLGIVLGATAFLLCGFLKELRAGKEEKPHRE